MNAHAAIIIVLGPSSKEPLQFTVSLLNIFMPSPAKRMQFARVLFLHVQVQAHSTLKIINHKQQKKNLSLCCL